MSLTRESKKVLVAGGAFPVGSRLLTRLRGSVQRNLVRLIMKCSKYNIKFFRCAPEHMGLLGLNDYV